LYTIISKAVADLPYLKPAVALVLGFVGGKMIGEYFHKSIPTLQSLEVVIFLIGGGVLLSYIAKRFRKGVDPFSGNKIERHDV
jgi:predicted tellurium resistance membrane protein TerC